MVPSFIRDMPDNDEPRLAVFDADGTLWEHDVADGCTLWLLQQGVLDTRALWPRYEEVYAADPPTGCEFLLRLYAGQRPDELQRHIQRYWEGDGRRDWIEQVVDSVHHLHERGYRIWVATGTPTDIVLPVMRYLPVERVLGMDFEVDAQGLITGRLDGIRCAGPGKAEKIRSLWDGPVQLVAGNALLDESMLRLARDVAWVVHPTAELEAIARAEGWPVLPSPHGPASETAKPQLIAS